MSHLSNLLLSYLLIGSGFGLLGFTTYGWLHPSRMGAITTEQQLLSGTFAFVLIALVVIGVGIHWHATTARAIASFDRETKAR